MKLKKLMIKFAWIVLGSAIFALGFDLFLEPNQIAAGGISGLALVVNHFVPQISMGTFMIAVNIPLFLAGYKIVGRTFFVGSLVGMAVSSVLIDVFTLLPTFQTEPLLGAIYGGILVGFGCGLVFLQDASTGGVDIAARLLKYKFRGLSLGKLMLGVDMCIAILTGFAFWDINKVLYCIVALYVSSIALDGVVYHFDYSKVALIVSDKDTEIAAAIDQRLERGCTYLKGEGSYTGEAKNVIFCAVKLQQVTELKDIVMEIDPSAFLVLQEAHQVLGEGFRRLSKDEL